MPIQQPDQLAVVGRGHDGACPGCGAVDRFRALEQFPQHCFRGGDPFGRVGAPEQLVE
jgi:hypothetical protein